MNSVNENDQTLIQHNSAGGLVQIDQSTKNEIKSCGGHYKAHAKKLNTIMVEFFGYLDNEPNLSSLCLDEVMATDPSRTKKAFFRRLSGKIDETKIKLINECLILFFLKSKKKYKLDAVDQPIPYSNEYQPAVMNMRLRALFGHFVREGIEIKLAKHFKFMGGLDGVMRNHYRAIRTSRPFDYGTRPNRAKYDEDGERKLRNKVLEGKFDLYDLKTVQMLCANALSTCMAMRGGDEIALLTWEQVDLEYMVERGDYAGMQGVKINNIIDKTCNLTMSNSYARDEVIDFYMVKNTNDVLCTHFLLNRLCSFCEPDQECVFCNKACKDKLDLFEKQGPASW